MANPQRIAVIGAGSWGTALVKLLTSTQEKVGWWVRKPSTIEHIGKYGHNPDYISAAQFEVDRLAMESDIHAVVKQADVLVLAVPSAFLKGALDQLDPTELKGKMVFSAVKGIVPETNQIVGEYLFQHWGVAESDFGVICGPCHAEEVAMERLSYLTIACLDVAKATTMGEALSGRFLKTTLSDDIYGTEYAAILKNVIAVCAGISVGLGYGDNFRAVLVSRAIQEVERFVAAVHPIDRDINEPAYLGDLLVTAYSTFSRNREFGTMVGKGYSVKAAQMEMNMVAEGYYAVKCVHEINQKLKVDMPIVESTYRMLYERMAPGVEMRLLSERLA
ncbi:MAG: NAD(P)H-dependent glycerol-3-phosphate dehydrogenase [Flavobacteriales bacterium]|jgi:glycerol-3-phosphate dehydrogenase (NAD(P)+)|nr:NAD(P)H-dependent glycerol-3-phosphate dehydrogenase [Flavobacteriales bacterium]MBK6550304.1 NAD(P)H-dependent glycerol-3-phosphate dehydrogenase [Flavobacteriales bacterium]MBK6881532.1 NAD(P)H-dependent glycerol-3-phosphate dehydrogenase [Flavobacteriales bacterium]MBK7102849.1 NAD(P)H-dependent glycerol-3-phosphate dehydrogenase [Flavobacteriales bacterium]MBK7113546.1 NAD(P)H-dependent glycerol-3-phosphate dehydrogenase [Flavobacteriales bacterium]